MIFRPFAAAATALLLLVGGCSSAEPAAPRAAASPTHRSFVRLPPAPKPLYGERETPGAWRTSGYTPQPIGSRHVPYSNELLSENILPAPVDEDGVRLYERHGKRYYHPVAIIQFALAKLDVAQRTDRHKPMRSAVINANKLLEIADHHDGGLYFAYPFDFPLGGREKHTIEAPWWSGMAQGQALSLFARLYQETGKQKWLDAANHTFLTMDDRGPRESPWTMYVNRRGYLWFEEYAGNTKPLLVLNGDMFAVFGLYDYFQLNENPKVEKLFDASVTTLREYLPGYREPGDVSYYCLRRPFCQQPLWQNEKYHGIVTTQMRIIADMTDDRWFKREAARFASDYVPADH